MDKRGQIFTLANAYPSTFIYDGCDVVPMSFAIAADLTEEIQFALSSPEERGKRGGGRKMMIIMETNIQLEQPTNRNEITDDGTE